MTEAATSNEPRGIAAAMSQPAFSTRMGQRALGVADRATRRWAPEAAEDQPRSMRALSFVDRMVAPWVTAAQQSAGLRMFSQYASNDVPERNISGVSWVFPRPWYQDELDWISASRASRAGHDMIFTTRGTYAAASDRQREVSVPPQLFEFVAPSFAPASSEGSVAAYSPLVSHSSYSAASVVAQSMQVIQAASAMARGLPTRMSAAAVEASAPLSSFAPLAGVSSLAPLVSSLIPDGESARFSPQPSALALRAPQLVTPPSPRPESIDSGGVPSFAAQRSEHAAQSARSEEETTIARVAAEAVARQEQSRAMAVAFAQERERIAEQMRITARQERERAEMSSNEPAAPVSPSQAAADAAVLESIRAEVVRQEAARGRETSSRVRSVARQQARIDAIVAERVAQLSIASADVSASTSGQAAVSSSEAQSMPVQAPAAPSQAQSQAMVQALRMAELLAHAAAVGPSAMAPAAGPRMALPTGLGGLVSGMNTVAVIHRERAFATEPAMRREGAPLPFVSGFQPVYTAPAVAEEHRAIEADGPVLPRASVWAPRVAAAPDAMRPDSALGAIASHSPAALSHVAWADRWLGRFAGASEASLDAMSTVAMRARLAPAQMFVAPMLESPRRDSVGPAGRFTSTALDVVAPRQDAAVPAQTSSPAPRTEAPRAAAPSAAPARAETLRFGDDDVVPDELFAAIAAGSARRETPRAATSHTSPPIAPRAVATEAVAPARVAAVQPSAADVVAMTAPSAPVDAGLSAALAASPMAAALGHVLSLPRAAVFDPRSLGGAELAAAFLAGAVSAPMVAQYSSGPLSPSFGALSMSPGIGGTGWEQTSEIEAPSLWRQWSAELVRPAELSRAAMREDGVISSALRPAASSAISATASSDALARAAAGTAALENIITMRSTLLSPPSPRQQRLAASAGTAASWATHEPADALPVAYQTLGELLSEAAPDRRWLSSLPMAATDEAPAPATFGWESPAMAARFDQGFPLVFWPQTVNTATAMGAMISERGFEPPRTDRGAAMRTLWGTAEPEQVTVGPSFIEQGVPGSMDRGALSPGMLAQRALGFGAVQSSQAADLSFDFVPPELVLAARVYGFGAAEAAQAARLAMGGSTGLSAMAGAVDLRFVSLANPTRVETGRIDTGRVDTARDVGGYTAVGRAFEETVARDADAAFGVPRRMPRGAFLLPSASVAAMGLSAAVPDGEHGMSIAALEVLAAKMVSELGSFASPTLAGPAAAAAGEPGMSASRRAPGTTMLDLTAPTAGEAMETSEAAVLSSAAASVAASRRARFESLYVALAETPSGRTMSPAARAARALALANRDEDAATLSSRERAALAWQIYPVVLSGEAASQEAREAQGARGEGAAARGRSSLELPTLASFERPGAEMRPGLSPLSSRAGEALSSFVNTASVPTEQRAAPPSESRSASWRSGRFGGGEVEIPEWFEAAARKMFEERGEIEGMSLAELTLVASTPPQQIAASTRETPSAVPPKQASPDGKGDKGQKVDIEKVASEVYRAVMQLMESARMRNGEPYL